MKKINIDYVQQINKAFGETLVRDADLKSAEDSKYFVKGKDKEMALWVRGIVVAHAFSDANKRTALLVVAEFKKIRNGKAIIRAFTKIADKHIVDLDVIVRMINNANRRKD